MFVYMEKEDMDQLKRKFGVVLVALFATLSLAIPLALASEPEDDPEAVKNCPAICRTLEYNGVWWWVEGCGGLPKACSVNPNARHQLTQRDLRVR